MKKLIKQWLGITDLEHNVEYVSTESSAAFNRATYAVTLALENVQIKPVKRDKKEVKKITKTNKSKK